MSATTFLARRRRAALPLLMMAALGWPAHAAAQAGADPHAAHAAHAAHAMHADHAAQAEPAAEAKPAVVPGASLYNLKGVLTDQDGRTFKLEQRRGQPMLVSMFYNSCKFVCPMLIDTLRSTEQTLTASERAKVGMLLITFDPARDDVKALETADNWDTDTLIKTMEGMTWDTPKGPMTFRPQDHQALQDMYHFKIKVDPNVKWAIPELVDTIKADQMNIPIGRNNQQ